MVIRSQALLQCEREGSETIPLWEYFPDLPADRQAQSGWEAPCPRHMRGDDIVHSFWKQEGPCNQLVVGSNPTHRADKAVTNSLLGAVAAFLFCTLVL